MKQILTIAIILNVTLPLASQENNAFVDSILSLIVHHEIPVYDEELLAISPLDLEIIRCDTIVCDEWTRPKYIDNVYYSAFDGALIYTKSLYDTVALTENQTYLQFVTKEYDENGNYQGTRVAFLINRNSPVYEEENNDSSELINLNGEFWHNDSIWLKGEMIKLDSCHAEYRLHFNEDHTFQQFYSGDEERCFTQEMKNDIKLGVEMVTDDELINFEAFYDKVEGHYLSSQKGRWYLKEDQLILWFSERKPLVFDLLSVRPEILILQSQDRAYKVRLRKVGR